MRKDNDAEGSAEVRCGLLRRSQPWRRLHIPVILQRPWLQTLVGIFFVFLADSCTFVHTCLCLIQICFSWTLSYFFGLTVFLRDREHGIDVQHQSQAWGAHRSCRAVLYNSLREAIIFTVSLDTLPPTGVKRSLCCCDGSVYAKAEHHVWNSIQFTRNISSQIIDYLIFTMNSHSDFLLCL